jgi:hypothetical protein
MADGGCHNGQQGRIQEDHPIQLSRSCGKEKGSTVFGEPCADSLD